MPADTDRTGISPKLEVILGRIPDAACAARLRKVYLAAAQTISRLSDIDLVKYETTLTAWSTDLSLWEEMAPVIRDTVVDVNALIAVVREHFPDPPAVEGDLGPSPAAPPTLRARLALQAASGRLVAEIARLGERMRDPAVVSDRWNLLKELQASRTRFREQLGNLVHSSALAFGEVHKKDVVPFYALELEAGLALRAVVADLTRVISARLERIREAEPEDVQWNAQQLEKELDTFGRTPAYRALRAQDKQRVLELRHHVSKVAARSTAPKNDLMALIAPFASFIAELHKVNKRETILQHDREVCAACAVKLESARPLVEIQPGAAALLLGEAATDAQALYGRDPALDVLLGKLRKQSVAKLKGPPLVDALAQLSEAVSRLQVC